MLSRKCFTHNKWVASLKTSVTQRFCQSLFFVGPYHSTRTHTDLGAGDSAAVQHCPDCREEFHIRGVLSIPVQKHWADEGRVRSRVVPYDGFTRVHDDGYVARAQIKSPVYAKDRSRRALIALTVEAPQIRQLLFGVQKHGR